MAKLLLVEDDVSTAKAYADFLTRKGYDVAQAFDGEEGLLKAKEWMPDAILLDIIMPKLDGISVLRKLKADALTQMIPVLILSNLESQQTVTEALAAGSTQYLVKSNYSLEDLAKRIVEVLGPQKSAQ